jgi:hypothetical protein
MYRICCKPHPSIYLGMEGILFNVVKVFPAGIVLEAVHAVEKAVGLCKNKPGLDTFPFPNVSYKQHFTK